jgi:hypothetical protein
VSLHKAQLRGFFIQEAAFFVAGSAGVRFASWRAFYLCARPDGIRFGRRSERILVCSMCHVHPNRVIGAACVAGLHSAACVIRKVAAAVVAALLRASLDAKHIVFVFCQLMLGQTWGWEKACHMPELRACKGALVTPTKVGTYLWALLGSSQAVRVQSSCRCVLALLVWLAGGCVKKQSISGVCCG